VHTDQVGLGRAGRTDRLGMLLVRVGLHEGGLVRAKRGGEGDVGLLALNDAGEPERLGIAGILVAVRRRQSGTARWTMHVRFGAKRLSDGLCTGNSMSWAEGAA
jgi:hypothetical protein